MVDDLSTITLELVDAETQAKTDAISEKNVESFMKKIIPGLKLAGKLSAITKEIERKVGICLRALSGVT